MDKMEILQGIIEENIEWFWNNDSLVDHETNMSRLWNGFKAWCVPNCIEVIGNIEESIVERAVDGNYNNWTEKSIF